MASKIEVGQTVTVKKYGPSELTGHRPWCGFTGRVFSVGEHSAVIDVTDCKNLTAKQKMVVNGRINVSFKDIAELGKNAKGVKHESAFNSRHRSPNKGMAERHKRDAERLKALLDKGYFMTEAGVKILGWSAFYTDTIKAEFGLQSPPFYRIRWTKPDGSVEYITSRGVAHGRNLVTAKFSGHVENQYGAFDSGAWVQTKSGKVIPYAELEGVGVG